MSTESLKETIGRNLKELRLKRGMTQEELARSIGMGWRNYQRYEKGKITPREENLNALAQVLGVEPAVILGQMPGAGGVESNVQSLAREFAILQSQVHDLVAWRRDREAIDKRTAVAQAKLASEKMDGDDDITLEA